MNMADTDYELNNIINTITSKPTVLNDTFMKWSAFLAAFSCFKDKLITLNS